MGEPLPLPLLRAGLAAWGLEGADVVRIVPGVTADVFLLLHGDRRWVAKYVYEYPEYAEVGLRVAQVVVERLGAGPGAEGYRVAVPVPTADGRLSVPVAWPPSEPEGVHPLAVLEFVGGDPLSGDDPDAPEVLGTVCGRVHAALLDVPPPAVGLTSLPAEPDGAYPDRDAGRFAFLHRLWRELEVRAWAGRASVRHLVGVWDGPDIRRRHGAAEIGLLDFGHCGWHALVHVVANRSLNAGLLDDGRVARFLTAVEAHLPLTASEHGAFPLHRLRNAAIYARWVAMERVERGDPSFNDAWFQDLLAMLRRELPRIGMVMPAGD